jgi:arylsulfatase
MGLFAQSSTPLPELMGRGKDWHDLDETERQFQAAKMAVHAAMVHRLDHGVGMIIQALQSAGSFEDTLIFFLSDNGASPEIPQRPGYDRSARTRDGRPIRYRGFPADELGTETTYTGIGPWWANAANTPFRYWKAESFEGGNHTPLIVSWPKGLKTKPGALTDQQGHVIDLLPTCLELAGADSPVTYRGRSLTPLDGRSLAPILRGEQRRPHDALFFEHENGRALIAGAWKLVKARANHQPWELYDLATDRTETRNLAAREPDRVRAMSERWSVWHESMMEPARRQAGSRKPATGGKPATERED